MNKKYFFSILILAIVSIGIYNYTYQEHRNIEKSEIDFNMSAKELLNEFVVNSEKATQKYLNKVIEVRGEVSEKDNESITLSSSVLCYFTVNQPDLPLAYEVIIKGRCIGFDELLEVVKVDQCSLIQ